MPGKEPAIAKIAIRGFKSIRDEQELEIRPLTILAGANSSGKSSIMQPLLLLKQTLEAPADPGALLLDGPNVKFTKSEQLLSWMPGEGSVSEFGISITLDNKEAIGLVFTPDRGLGFELSETEYFDRRKQIRLRPGMPSNEIADVLPFPEKSFREVFEKEGEKDLQWHVVRQRCFHGVALRQEGIDAHDKSSPVLSPGYSSIVQLEALIHLPGLRGTPSRTYPKSAVGRTFPGTFEQYVASVIADWKAEKDPLLKRLGEDLQAMGLTWKVEASVLDATRFELRVARLPRSRRGGARDLVSIADVGFGLSQVLPVVVSLIVARPGQVIYLEQPEIHLHPLAQRQLARLLASAASEGKRLVVETHSALLLRQIQALVAQGKLSPDIVKLHWFQRDTEGFTAIESAELDEEGAYGDWPQDFDEVELQAESEYLDAVAGRGEGA